MKKSKKVWSVLLAGMLAVAALTACTSNETGTDSAGTNASTSTSMNTSTKEDTNNSDSDESVIRIGGIGPTTGGAAVYGQAVKNGAQIAVDEINANGGIAGIPIEFNFQDDEHDAEKAVNAYNTLKDWGMQVLLGTVTSGPCVAVGENANADNTFLLTPSATSVEAIKYDNAFRVCFSDPSQGAVSAQYISDENLAQSIAIIYDSSDTYSSGIYESFAGQANELGLEIVSAEAFTADSNTDFSVQLQKAKDSGADLVFLPFYYQEISLVLKQAEAIDYSPIFFSCDGFDGILSLDGFDTAVAEGVMFLSPFAANSADEMVQSFVTTFEEKFGEVPNQFAADGYDGIYIFKAAMEAAGVTAEMSASEISDLLKVAMTEITVDGTTGKSITWEANGEPQKEPMVLMVENGEYKEL